MFDREGNQKLSTGTSGLLALRFALRASECRSDLQFQVAVTRALDSNDIADVSRTTTLVWGGADGDHDALAGTLGIEKGSIKFDGHASGPRVRVWSGVRAAREGASNSTCARRNGDGYCVCLVSTRNRLRAARDFVLVALSGMSSA